MAKNLNDIRTFSELLSHYGVEIPLIQRDYVQGRVHCLEIERLKNESGDKAKELLKLYVTERERRDNFVERLVRALVSPEMSQIQLAFIYGTIEKTSKDERRHEDSLFPLDGQQRLTTLFLLSWLLVYKQTVEDRLSLSQRTDYVELKKGLRSFTYKTRPTSQAFCASLIDEKISIPSDVTEKPRTVSGLIKEQPWFGDEWCLDPSVQAMLQMLDQMETELAKQKLDEKDVKSMLENLLGGKGIEFELLNMQDYKLTDGLYIKMNARGKQLTEFENWKAEFTGFLKERYSKTSYNGPIDQRVLEKGFKGRRPTIVDYFSYSIEHQWTDLFWNYCKEKLAEMTSSSEQDVYPVIDEYFIAVFDTLTTVFYYDKYPAKTRSEAKALDDERLKAARLKLYSEQENVENLFVSLDLLCQFSESMFREIFYVDDNQNTMRNGKVRLFDGKGENLLTRCVKKTDATAEAVTLLYALLKYAREFGCTVDADMKSFVRSIRNCIRRKSTHRSGEPTMSLDYYLYFIHVLTYGVCVAQYVDELIAEKKSKGMLAQITPEEAAIEDLDFIQGYDKMVVPGASAAQVLEVLRAWDALELVKKQQLLISYGYKGRFSMVCSHGVVYLWGGENKWDPIFMVGGNDKNGEGTINDVVCKIVNDYLSLSEMHGATALLHLLANKKLQMKSYGFKYYAVTYDEFLLAHAQGRRASCHLSVNGGFEKIDSLDLISAEYGSRPIARYHTDPMIFVLKEKLCGLEVASPSQVYTLSWSFRASEKICLQVYGTGEEGKNSPLAEFRHKAGLHGQGCWERLKPGSADVVATFPDEPTKDRIQAGVECVTREFPNAIFKGE